MARVRATLNAFTEMTLTSGQTKTLMQVLTAANHPCVVKGFSVSFDGTSVTAEPITVDLLRQSSAGTGSSQTPVEDTAFAVTVQTGGLVDHSGEPTAAQILRSYNVHSQGGIAEKFNLEDEIVVPGASRLGLRVRMPSGVNCKATGFLTFEE